MSIVSKHNGLSRYVVTNDEIDLGEGVYRIERGSNERISREANTFFSDQKEVSDARTGLIAYMAGCVRGVASSTQQMLDLEAPGQFHGHLMSTVHSSISHHCQTVDRTCCRRRVRIVSSVSWIRPNHKKLDAARHTMPPPKGSAYSTAWG